MNRERKLPTDGWLSQILEWNNDNILLIGQIYFDLRGSLTHKIKLFAEIDYQKSTTSLTHTPAFRDGDDESGNGEKMTHV